MSTTDEDASCTRSELEMTSMATASGGETPLFLLLVFLLLPSKDDRDGDAERERGACFNECFNEPP